MRKLAGVRALPASVEGFISGNERKRKSARKCNQNKIGPAVFCASDSPKLVFVAKALRPEVTRSYLRYLHPQGMGMHSLRGHRGSGPPSGAGSIGAATATYVVTRPSISTTSLITFFIGFSPWLTDTGVANCNSPARPRIIQVCASLFGDSPSRDPPTPKSAR
jgi:hypothetical protein